ncbi:MAG: YggT family protein [Gammaproteobacteria bacterium]|nr:YggT family protein [Gammaproteobacteria bacterium]
MGNYLAQPLAFLISTVFGLYILLIMLRFLLARVGVDFYNPISQFLVKATNPGLRPLRRVIPGLWGIDFASVVLMLLLQSLLGLILRLLEMPFGSLLYATSTAGIGLWAISELVALVFNVFIFSILIHVILSWVNPGTYNPVTVILHGLNEPILRPIRRMMPVISGFDLSPLLALVGLQILKMLVMPPLIYLIRIG